MNSFQQQTLRQNKPIRTFLWMILVAATVIMSVRTVMSSSYVPDSWLHMGVGRYILEYKKIPTHADISIKSSEPGLEWIAHSWLADLLLYLGAGANTTVSSWIVLPVMLALTLGLLSIIGVSLRISRPIIALMLIIGSVGTISFWKIHPFVFLPSLLLCMTYVLLRWTSTQHRRHLVILMLLVWLWANISGGFMFIPLLYLAAFCTETCVGMFWNQKVSSRLRLNTLRVWLGVLFGSLLVSIATPNGIRGPIYNLTVIALLNARKWYSTLGGALEATNTSNIKFAPSNQIFIFTLLYCLSMFGMLTYIVLARNSRATTKLRPLLSLTPFLFLPFLWIRFIPLAIIASLPLFGVLCTSLLDDILRLESRRKRLLEYGALVGTATLVAWMSLSPPKLLLFSPPKEQFNFFILHSLPQPLLLSTDLIGYAYWRLYPSKGFIDAQDDVYDEHDALAIYAAYSPVDATQIDDLMKTYNFSSIMVTKENDYLTGYFSNLPDWSLVYLDYNGILFIKNSIVPDDFIKTHALTAINFSLDLGSTPDHISTAIQELVRFTKEFPNSTLAVGQLATMYRYNKQLTLAETTLNTIPESKWNYVIKTEMGRIKAAQGLCEAAEGWFLSAINERNEKNISRTTFDLAVLYAVCLDDIPKAKHFFKRYTSYPIPNQERERATQLMKKMVSDIDSNEL